MPTAQVQQLPSVNTRCPAACAKRRVPAWCPPALSTRMCTLYLHEPATMHVLPHMEYRHGAPEHANLDLTGYKKLLHNVALSITKTSVV